MTEIFMFIAFMLFVLYIDKRQKRRYNLLKRHIELVNNTVGWLRVMLLKNNEPKSDEGTGDETFEDRMEYFQSLHSVSHNIILESLKVILFSIQQYAIHTEQYESAQELHELIQNIDEVINLNTPVECQQ